MFPRSLRWRLQLWMGFLLVCVLSGFGTTVYQLQRINQFNQIDLELEHRVETITSALRRPPFGPRHGHGPFENGPGRPDFDPGTNPPSVSAVPGQPLENGWPQRGRGRDFHPPPDGPGRPDFDWGTNPPPIFAPFWRVPEGPWPPRPRVREFHPSPEVLRLFDESDKDGFYFAIWSRDASAIKVSSNAPASLIIPLHADETQTHIRSRDQLREAFHFTEFGDCVLAGRPVTTDLAALRRFALWLLAAGGAVLAFGLGGGWWLATRAIRPIENIIAAASRISEGKLSERVNGAGADSELGRLASVLNSTFARLEAAFARQQQFTTDASHELRTPLAVLISEAQTALARPRSAPEYRETLEYSLAAAQQMRRLTDALLELSRFDANQDQIPRSPLDLAALTRDCVARLQPVAREKQVEIHSDLQPAMVSGNPDRFGQVLTNLLSNAIHYNKPSGEIRVATRLENGEALLVVTDTGLGMAEEDLPHIFERFYRADKSRSRSDGRYGLGLAICKAIVEGEGGRIGVTSRLGEGSAFTVHLPAHTTVS